MKNTSINISGKISDEMLATYTVIHDTVTELQIPYLVVGATARDLVMHHGFGAPIQRATMDADFGLEVSSWNTFDAFRNMLLQREFVPSRHPHRLTSPQGIPIDVVPFGAIADQDANITWPPDNNFKMEVLGFQEACDNALNVCIKEEPELTIRVATPPGLALMKVIAWKDREREKRKKDANDLFYLLQYYEKIPTINDQLYREQTLAERYEWDIEIAGAHQLGIDTKQIAEKITSAVIENALDSKFYEIIQDISDSTDRSEILLRAFRDGFSSQ